MKTKKVRIYYPFFPFPPTEGSFHVVFDQIRSFSHSGYEVELVCWREKRDQITHKLSRPYPDSFPEGIQTTVLETEVGPESATERFLRVSRSFFSSLSSPEILFYPPETNPFLASPVDLAIYNYGFAYSWLKKENLSEQKRVVVFHNLESVLSQERILGVGIATPSSWVHRLNSLKLKRHELKLGGIADELWFVSPEDLKTYKKSGGDGALRYVPPGFSKEFYSSRTLQSRQKEALVSRPVLGFVGALDFLPNTKSALWIIEKLAPLLHKKAFQGEIRIVGKGASDQLKELAQQYSFIHFYGFLNDLEGFWASLDFSLVPHVSGSGVRMKLLESLASGVPTLATSGAASRIDPRLLQNQFLRVSDQVEDWVDWITSPDSLHLRREMCQRSLPDELDYQAVYSFLLSE